MKEMKRSSKSLPKANGFVNLVLVDKNHVRHTFKMGIPLYNDRKIDAMLLGDPDMINRLSVEQVELTVNPIKEPVDPVF